MKNSLTYGLGAVLLGLPLHVSDATAGAVTISTERTTEAATADIDGGAAGDITVANTGSIKLDAGTALTLNSSHSIINNGLVQIEDAPDSIGALLLGGNTGSFQNGGTILLTLENSTSWASGKTGLAVTGTAPFIGDISNEATGTINVIGDTSYGVSITTDVSGDFINNGKILAQGSDNTGIFIDGAISGSFENVGSITVESFQSSATGLVFGTNASVPLITNSGTLSASNSQGKEAYSSVALETSAAAGSQSLVNSGAIAATGEGIGGFATAILDHTGAISTVTNTGTIHTLYKDTSTNDVVASFGTALDLSANTTGIVFSNNQAASDLNGNTGIINGDVFLGSGNDTVTMGSGQITGDFDLADGNDSFTLTGGVLFGDLSFGAGNDTFFLGSGAMMVGDLLTQTSVLSGQIDGTLALQSAQTISLSNLIIGANAQISIPIDPASGTSASFDVSGTAVIASTATFTPLFTSVQKTAATYDFVSASTLTLSDGLPVLNVTNASFLYEIALALDTTDPLADRLQLSIMPKTTTELGLSPLQSTLYFPLLEAANTDAALTTAVHLIEDKEELQDTLDELMPNNTAAQFMMNFLTFQGVANSATGKRILLNPPANNASSARFWLEQAGSYRDQRNTDDVRGYIGREFKMSGGIEVSTRALDRLGLAITRSYVGFQPDEAPTKPWGSTSTWGSLYGTYSTGNFTLNAIGSAALSKYRSDRSLAIAGTQLKARGDWSGSLYGAQIEGKYRLEKNGLYADSRASLAWLSMSEDDYKESGDVGVAYRASDFSMSGARGELATVFGVRLGDQNQIVVAELELGVRKDFGGSDETRDYTFVGGTTAFTLMTPAPENEEAAIVGLNVFGTSNLTSLGFSYKGAFASDWSDHQFKAVLKSRF